MSTITRGHSFGINDVVTAETLNNLVRLAQISGLTVADISGSTVQISIGSAPSGAAPGWLSAEYERHLLSTHASYSIFQYVLATPNFHRVALFNQYGLETNRFINAEDTWLPGSPLLIRTLGSPGITLQATGGFTTGFHQHRWLGSSLFTSPSGVSVSPRIVLKGPCPARYVDGGADLAPKYLWLFNSTSVKWQHSPGATNINKVAGFSLDGRLDGDTVIPAFMFGSPLWRGV